MVAKTRQAIDLWSQRQLSNHFIKLKHFMSNQFHLNSHFENIEHTEQSVK
ncbi:hypothetical protein VCHA37P191_20293 [Vibrio chagasii]|nr:hypothetical protein VCHA31O73_40063 [Vibrio chagasii]CAH7230508.1 hypothetical protein VCHA37P191_20293 [Vibrio chagasii]CAH7360669.1 hypothetical protein VCHA41O247_50176 [Vibrio chagasii]